MEAEATSHVEADVDYPRNGTFSRERASRRNEQKRHNVQTLRNGSGRKQQLMNNEDANEKSSRSEAGENSMRQNDATTSKLEYT
ncbi:hypothetical protein R1flu_018900 [Riccia fluitans]|uniref:Uncharacterized protein n=1 Tax=Riccia fluitans TaxID=41844 RepID=A0ABD1ZHD3_9MARC